MPAQRGARPRNPLVPAAYREQRAERRARPRSRRGSDVRRGRKQGSGAPAGKGESGRGGVGKRAEEGIAQRRKAGTSREAAGCTETGEDEELAGGRETAAEPEDGDTGAGGTEVDEEAVTSRPGEGFGAERRWSVGVKGFGVERRSSVGVRSAERAGRFVCSGAPQKPASRPAAAAVGRANSSWPAAHSASLG